MNVFLIMRVFLSIASILLPDGSLYPFLRIASLFSPPSSYGYVRSFFFISHLQELRSTGYMKEEMSLIGMRERYQFLSVIHVFHVL